MPKLKETDPYGIQLNNMSTTNKKIMHAYVY